MQLPTGLREAIERAAAGIPGSELARAAAEISSRYRTGASPDARYLSSEAHRIAYLATRMPATYAVLRRVFEELNRARDGQQVESLLDLGAGPGTALWAAAETFNGLEVATLIENDHALIKLGRMLAEQSDRDEMSGAGWQAADIRRAALTPHDLVVCSYSIGELGASDARDVIRRAWEAARLAVILIEPGTKRGFAMIDEFRDQLIGLGAYLAAPCPHSKDCPIEAGDWCHFAARVDRTSLHRYLKTGEKGHEDEKFSYLIAMKTPARRAAARVIRHPRHHSGFTQLTLCGQEGIEKLTVTRSQKEFWRKARKVNWGDEWGGGD